MTLFVCFLMMVTGRTVSPEPWTVAKPHDEVKIQPGNEVFVSAISNMRFDPCCGKSKVDSKGDLGPLCLLKIRECWWYDRG